MVNAHQWLDAIMKRLFEPEARRIDNHIKKLTEKNIALKGGLLLGFIHLGEVYLPKENEPLYKATSHSLRGKSVQPLAFELIQEASDFISDIKKLNLDKAQIKQVLFHQIINACNLQEIRDALPECIVPLMPELKGLNRQLTDPTYWIRSDPRAVKEFNRMLPKIEFYAMTRMIY
jgi:hypothetical protein